MYGLCTWLSSSRLPRLGITKAQEVFEIQVFLVAKGLCQLSSTQKSQKAKTSPSGSVSGNAAKQKAIKSHGHVTALL